MSESEKMIHPPMGELGGKEYVAKERDSAVNLLRQRVESAREKIQRLENEEESDLRDARAKAADAELATAEANLKSALEKLDEAA